MKTVCKENMCSGCMACKEVCINDAIYIKRDIEHYNAVINPKKCLDCGLCYNVCQQNTRKDLVDPLNWYQGWVLDDNTRMCSSSGGIAYEIERSFIRSGGIIYSCVFKDSEFVFQSADKEEDVIKFVGSKYVKSNADGVYKEIHQKIREGRKVLFVALPCQVAALKNIVTEKDQENLYTIDLICHGTPDPELLDIYLKQYGQSLESISDIVFRVKKKFQVRSNYKAVEGVSGICDHYSIAFLNAICYTDSCYHCNYATTARISDVTLGDSWGSKLSDDQKRKGISLVLCQSVKGVLLLENNCIHLEPVDIELAIMNNHPLKEPAAIPSMRGYFFRKIKAGKNFNVTIFLCFPWICFKQFIKKILIRTRIIGGGPIEYSLSIIKRC